MFFLPRLNTCVSAPSCQILQFATWTLVKIEKKLDARNLPKNCAITARVRRFCGTKRGRLHRSKKLRCDREISRIFFFLIADAPIFFLLFFPFPQQFIFLIAESRTCSFLRAIFFSNAEPALERRIEKPKVTLSKKKKKNEWIVFWQRYSQLPSL